MLEIKIMKKLKLIMVSIAKKHKKTHKKQIIKKHKQINQTYKHTHTTPPPQIQRTINWKQTQKFKNSMEMFDDLMFNCLTD